MVDLPLIVYNFKATAQSDQFAETAAGEAGAARDWQEEVRRHQEKAPEAPEGKRRHQEKAGSAVKEQEKEARLDGSTAVKELVSSAISAKQQLFTKSGLNQHWIDRSDYRCSPHHLRFSSNPLLEVRLTSTDQVKLPLTHF